MSPVMQILLVTSIINHQYMLPWQRMFNQVHGSMAIAHAQSQSIASIKKAHDRRSVRKESWRYMKSIIPSEYTVLI